MKTFFVILFIVLFIGLSAQSWTETQKVLASDGVFDDKFGWTASISGNYAVISAVDDDDNGDESGSAYIFYKDGTTWTEQAKLTASDGAPGDAFGISVSISGDYAVIGACLDDACGLFSGSAYIFHRSDSIWTEQVKLIASDGTFGDFFGMSVSISGDYAVIGTTYDDDNGNDSGSAYIYHRNGTTWTEQAKLTASDAAAADRFGKAVSISGDYVAVGAYFDDDNGNDSGSVYVFNRSGTSWTEQAKLTASDGALDDYFGFSVSLTDNDIVVGAYQDDDNGTNSGSAYVFIRNGTTWTEQVKLTASDGALDDWFGKSVSISGDDIVIGAYKDDDNGIDSGSAYVFNRNGTTWTELIKLTASDGSVDDMFGCSVSISGDLALIGASMDDDNGTNSGSAYFWDCIPDQPIVVNNLIPPEGDVNLNETESQLFEIDAYDPDGNTLNYDWLLDGVNVSADSFYTLITDYTSAGDYILELNVTDFQNTLRDSLTFVWNIHVNNLDQEIIVTELSYASESNGVWTPEDQMINLGESLEFLIWAVDPDGNVIEYNWLLDGTSVATDSSYSFDTDYLSSGNYLLELNVTDNSVISNRDSLTYSWNISVCDLGTEESNIVSVTTRLISCYPNPFNPVTTISFSVKEQETATLEIFNLKGQKIKSYHAFASGIHEVIWNGKDDKGNKVSSGLFFYRLKSESVQQVRKVLLLK
ncbi:MAG: T9SS type A sorting domain-containing protein [Candidatus Cloacimonetes bacterium]|nr:T9SS type A sorting domain-containing protein [Candidatus Cloacimonadota bacterium]